MNHVRAQFRKFLLTAIAGLTVLSAAQAAPGGGKPSAPTIDFKRDISAILSDNCFACHGPDDKERKSKLRSHRREDAINPAKSRETATVPGDPPQPEFLRRLNPHAERHTTPAPRPPLPAG